MALRDARGQGRLGSACRVDRLLKLLENTDLTGLSSSLKTYLAPLLGSSWAGKENGANIEVHKLAREFVPFLLKFLKLCGTRLASVPLSGDAAACAKSDEIFSAMAMSLDGLNRLRHFITGCSFEIELQRYILVRRLIAWKQFRTALAQCEILFRSLCQLNSAVAIRKQSNTAKTSKGGRTNKKTAIEDVSPEEYEILGPPNVGGEAEGLPALTVATVIDLIWCTAESATGSSCSFENILPLPEQLAPWISLLDAGNAVKQRDALFRALYKCTVLVVAEPTRFETNLIQQLCKLTLDHCASSSQCNQYAKVARKFCTSLSSADLDGLRIALEICSRTLSDISSKDELEGVRRSIEVLELVDWFSRSCQGSNQVDYGWCQVYEFVCAGEKVSADIPVALAGLYGIGLLLSKVEEEQCPVTQVEGSHVNGLKRMGYKSEAGKCETSCLRDACLLLHRTEEVLNWIVQLPLSSTLDELKTEEKSWDPSGGRWQSHLSGLQQEGDEFIARLFLGIARALQYLQKPVVRYVQTSWNEYVSGSLNNVFSLHGNINGQLRKLLKLCYSLVERGMRCPRLSENDRDILSKSFQLASQMTVAALRLSLLQNSDIKEMSDLVMGGIQHLVPEEQCWLMSSTYNMGVQLFNAKQYSLACWPLELAYKAAWARINPTLCTKKSDVSYTGMLSEACMKCSVLADARSRNGEPGEAKFILIDGIESWARVRALAFNIQAPHALVKSFIKLVCAEMKSSPGSNGEGRTWSLYGVLGALEPPVHAETLGLLLEEELAACKTVRELYPQETGVLEAEILGFLLERVYTGESSLVEKSRILVEKSRGSRLRDSGNLPSAMKDVSEALCLMEAALNNMANSTKNLPRLCVLKRLMAVAYSMMAIYSYELNPLSQDFYLYTVKSINTWQYLLELKDQGSFCEAQNPQCTTEPDEEPLVLLLSLMDLLHIQGYSVVLIQIYELILRVSAYLKQSVPTAEFLCFIMNRGMSHLLCPVFFPSEILSNTRQLLDSAAEPLEYWQDNMRLYSGSMMEAQLLEIQENASCQCGATKEKCRRMDELGGVEKIKKMANFTLLDGHKSIGIVLHSAGLRHIIAKRAYQRGELTDAIKYANEAYQLRSKCFKRTYRGFEKRSSQTVSADNQEVDVLTQRGVPTSSWPFTLKVQQFLCNPSQWRILGDYVESLMQVGVIHEKLGAADDAERFFREGLRIATAQNLPMVLGWFSSSLGEVYRKRLMWESAENHFIKAKEAIERLDASTSCKSCILTGKALLQIRIGDLVRHNWYYQKGQSSSSSTLCCLRLFRAENLMDAVTWYTVATGTLSGSSEESDVSSFPGEVPSASSLVTRQREMLSNLREHGKKVSNKIMAAVEEMPCPAGSRARKPRLRRSMQTRSSTLIDIGPDETQEKDLETLCEDLSLVSVADDESSSLRRKTRSLVKPVINVGKGTVRSAQVGNESGGHLLSVELPGRLKMTRTSLKMKKELVANLIGEEVDRIDINDVDEGHCSTLEDEVPLGLLSLEEWPRQVWNYHLRKFLARVSLQRGKCLVQLGQISEAAEVYRKAMSMLYDNCSSCICDESTSSSAPVEEGAILYHMSRLLLLIDQHDESSRQRQRSSRRQYDYLEHHKLETINRLYRAFNLCHQVPPILRKIAKLLAILYVGRPEESPLLKPGLIFSGLETVELAAYFHQLSLGTTIRQQHLAALDSKLSEKSLNCQLSSPSCSSDCIDNMQRALRVVPLSADNLRGQVKDFLNSVPPLSVCCISFVDEADVTLVAGESNPGSTVCLLVTRFTYGSTPVVVLLPVGPLHTSMTEGVQCSPKKSDRILEKVAAEFESVFEESRESTSGTHSIATPEEKSLWWKWRMQLDTRLEVLVRTIEVSWLGHLKCLLLAEPKETATIKSFESVADHLVNLLVSVGSSTRESSYKNMKSLVHSLLKGVDSFTDSDLQRAIAEILGWKDYCLNGIHNGDGETDCKKRQCKSLESVKQENLQKLTRSFRAAFNNLYRTCGTHVTEEVLVEESSGRRSSRKQPKSQTGRKKNFVSEVLPDGGVKIKSSDGPVKRQPLQLILDSDAQALPWESLPVVREYEVYRMPSLGNVLAIYIQHQFESVADKQLLHDSEGHCGNLARSKTQCYRAAAMNMTLDQPLEVTFVNPCNTFYILNPGGDLKSTQLSFEDWFMHLPGWKGKAGTPPTAEEFKKGLLDFDLFVYLGHGTGDQFLPERVVRQLDQCAATLLMGCSSGRLSPRGQYEPFGTVLSYLIAGCPSVIANLWDVTDGDIDRFSKFLLQKWMALESASHGNDELNKGSSYLGDCERAMKETIDLDMVELTGDATEIVRLSSAVGQSRKACRLPYLIGASPVCYGVPTGLRKQVLSAPMLEHLLQ